MILGDLQVITHHDICISSKPLYVMVIIFIGFDFPFQVFKHIGFFRCPSDFQPKKTHTYIYIYIHIYTYIYIYCTYIYIYIEDFPVKPAVVLEISPTLSRCDPSANFYGMLGVSMSIAGRSVMACWGFLGFHHLWSLVKFTDFFNCWLKSTMFDVIYIYMICIYIYDIWYVYIYIHDMIYIYIYIHAGKSTKSLEIFCGSNPKIFAGWNGHIHHFCCLKFSRFCLSKYHILGKF